MRIHLTTTAPDNRDVAAILADMRAGLEALAPRHTAAESPDAADAILFVESPENKYRPYARLLAGRPEVRGSPERCFALDYSDDSVALLPGLYFSLPGSRFDLRRCRAVPAWGPPAPSVYEEVLADTAGEEPALLFSFRGFRSASVRASIFGEPFAGVQCAITETTGFWTVPQGSDEHRAYLREIRASRFALAPRGLATSTARVYEIMRLGRPPVVLSDEWVPPLGIPWHDVAVRVAERDVARLPEVLRSLEPWAEEMGANARAAWERFCAPPTVLTLRVVQQLEELLLAGDSGERRAAPARWTTARFAWEHGWHPAQGAARRAQATLRRMRPGR